MANEYKNLKGSSRFGELFFLFILGTVTELGEYLAAVSKTLAAGRKINEEKDVLKAIST
ncbi:MAG: hypothetical protein ABH952_04300 [Candidatus Omnitrophota bacterium]